MKMKTTINCAKTDGTGYSTFSMDVATEDSREFAEQLVQDGDADEATIDGATYTRDGWTPRASSSSRSDGLAAAAKEPTP
jgi:hypothetical protein